MTFTEIKKKLTNIMNNKICQYRYFQKNLKQHKIF